MKKTYRFLLIPFAISLLSLAALFFPERIPLRYRYAFAVILLVLLAAAFILVYRLL